MSPTRQVYRAKGEQAWCEGCGDALCIHQKRFCSQDCLYAWQKRQPKVTRICTGCSSTFEGKPWRKRCDTCVERATAQEVK